MEGMRKLSAQYGVAMSQLEQEVCSGPMSRDTLNTSAIATRFVFSYVYLNFEPRHVDLVKDLVGHRSARWVDPSLHALIHRSRFILSSKERLSLHLLRRHETHYCEDGLHGKSC